MSRSLQPPDWWEKREVLKVLSAELNAAHDALRTAQLDIKNAQKAAQGGAEPPDSTVAIQAAYQHTERVQRKYWLAIERWKNFLIHGTVPEEIAYGSGLMTSKRQNNPQARTSRSLLGPLVEEGRGKRTGRRVIATAPQLRVEASIEESATFLGIRGVSVMTYTSNIHADGILHSDGEGAFASLHAGIVSWKATGAGRVCEDGKIDYFGSLDFATKSERLARLDGACGVLQSEIDAQGNTHSRIWEFVPHSRVRALTRPVHRGQRL